MSSIQPTRIANPHELLSTKLAPPRPRSSLVAREALLTRLDEGLDCKLTLLSAPAGFGKTTLVSEWISTRLQCGTIPSVAWVSLDAGDNDPVRFWRYIVAACQTFDESIGASALGLLDFSRNPTFEPMLTALINDLAQLPQRGVLVLEDYNLIDSAAIHAAFAFLLDHLPTSLHIVIMTRSDPPLPLARLRVRHDLMELHAPDLRFSTYETVAFYQQTLQLPLSHDTISRLETHTEGWVAGLRLVALALQGRQDVEHFLATFTGSHRHILEYLVTEVLTSQPPEVQEFLLQTTFLSRLSGSLCDAVTGRDDSDLVLAELESANLFLVPLDGGWYRYHAMFAEAMHHYARRHWGEAKLRELYHQASVWYEQRGFLEEAVETALIAQAFSKAAGLIERLIARHRFQSELCTLRRWLEQMPESLLREHPILCLNYSVALLFTGDRHAPATLHQIQPYLKMAEAYWRAEENWHCLGELLALWSMVLWWQSDFVNSFEMAQQAHDLLPEGANFWRGVSTIQIASMALFYGKMSAIKGEMDSARQQIIEARALCLAANNPYGARAALQMLGEVCIREGDLNQAIQHFQQVISESNEDLSDLGEGLLGFGTLAFERNDLETAEQKLTQALELGIQAREEPLRIRSMTVLAHTHYAQGRVTQAEALLRSFVTQTHWLMREIQMMQAWLALKQGDLAFVQRWYIDIAQATGEISVLQQEREAMIAARLHVQQNEFALALQVLNQWGADAREKGRFGSELEVIVLKALAYFNQNQVALACQTLLPILPMTQRQNYQRLFLEEGEDMAALLRVILPQIQAEALGIYVRNLLRAFAATRAAVIAPSTSETLSPQEQRVLRLMAAGFSNPEIAKELVVSINTIKTQVKSIYRKLNVSNRDEIRDAAHHLKLG